MTNTLALCAAVAGLLVNGDFSNGLGGFFGGPYGGGPGSLTVADDGDPCAHLAKERGPGATQMLRGVPAGGAGTFAGSGAPMVLRIILLVFLSLVLAFWIVFVLSKLKKKTVVADHPSRNFTWSATAWNTASTKELWK